MTKIIKLLLIILSIVVVGYFSYKYISNIGSRNLETEEVAFSLSAQAIHGEFAASSEKATSKYFDKAVEISGTVSSIDSLSIVLDEKVFCQMQTSHKIQENQILKIKGRVTGYDDLLEELKLDQCIIVK